MRQERVNEIITFLRDNIEPLDDGEYGFKYRVSVYLNDGTFLPCVVFRNPNPVVNLAIRRLDEEHPGRGFFKIPSKKVGYYDIVKSFVTSGNCISYYDIDRIETCRYAFPITVLSQIRGETTMGWTGFVAQMSDGKYLSFGTSFDFMFFQMPDNYSTNDIEKIINHSYALNTGELRKFQVPFPEFPPDYKDATIYKSRSYFECYIDNL